MPEKQIQVNDIILQFTRPYQWVDILIGLGRKEEFQAGKIRRGKNQARPRQARQAIFKLNLSNS
jgi:hypothetical protein